MVRRQGCIVQGCSQDEEDEMEYESMDQAQKAMEMHLESHRLGNAASVLALPIVAHAQHQRRIPKSIPPKLEMGILSQEWEYFLGDWRWHKGYCSLVEQNDLVYNLWWCLSADLK